MIIVRVQTSIGEICFSLRYVPATAELTVVLLEIKNLRLLASGEYPGQWVQVVAPSLGEVPELRQTQA